MDAALRSVSSTSVAPALLGVSTLGHGGLGQDLKREVAHLHGQFYEKGGGKPSPRCRWLMLAILSMNICVSYLPYYTFVPIMTKGMDVYKVGEADLNLLCIVYALVYVPCAFLTGPLIGSFGCRWTFIIAMALSTFGCVLRCGPEFTTSLVQVLFVSSQPVSPIDTVPSFAWLVWGQTLCALGQPFLVNSTSQVGAEWFPPHERPAAGMISNLMNFVGSSLSFVIPPLVVSDEIVSTADSRRQILVLMQLQLGISFALLLVTVLFYQHTPASQFANSHRQPVSFLVEIKSFLRMRDFWLVNGQFMLYMAVCHAFDAVEGSLLEDYGYSASLSSWTAVACATTSIASTILEAIYITDPASYQSTLIVVNIILAASQAIGGICLFFKLHAIGFVLSIGFMGLSTPGWGCTVELGSEVCFPAREATVCSVLEACGNMTGVVAIILVQRLLDAGVGAGVMLIMASCALLGSSLMRGLSGRLRRSEAERNFEQDNCEELSVLKKCSDGDTDGSLGKKMSATDIDKPSAFGLQWSHVLRLGGNVYLWCKGIVDKFRVEEVLVTSAREPPPNGQDRVKEWSDSVLWAIPSSGL